MIRKKNKGLTYNVYLSGCEHHTEIALTIGGETFLMEKEDANHIAAQLAYLAGDPAKLQGPDKPMLWDEKSDFVKQFRHLFNEFGEFS